MDTEIIALVANKTWDVIPLPPSQHSIGCTWVYNYKHNEKAIKNWSLYQLDINNAFLHGDLHETIYMQLLKGYTPSGFLSKNSVVLRLEFQFFSDLLRFNFSKRQVSWELKLSLPPYISYAVNTLSQLLHELRTPHLHDAHRILHYLKGTPGQGLIFYANSNPHLCAFAESNFKNVEPQLKKFSDADWGSWIDTRRSITGYCVFLGLMEVQKAANSFQILS
ncbi:uncharacterized protein LOC115704027 [Cannabis sativa]|uniref:uncharacterized protein LOC115704027 n=1 Tax=Cannabis sativa TaxID=3483 RepID=UPI0029CA7282|nr:uncharacterized protein LOC115704027 [Cannabis sativa]